MSKMTCFAKSNRLAAMACAGALALAASTPSAVAGVKLGVLQCEVGKGVGLIVMEKESMICTFHSNTGATEHYYGHIRKFGLEVGITGGSIVVWAVAAATDDYAPGSLAGKYAGISAEASAVLGVGANALLGGSKKSFALQPLSVQGQVGLDIGLGITSMDLEPRA